MSLYHPTGDGYLNPTIKALIANGLTGGGEGGTPTDLSGYVTTGALTTALAGKADLASLLNYATTTDLSNVASGVVSLSAASGFTVNELNKIYVIHCTAGDTTVRTVNLNFTYDQTGTGWILIYNAGFAAPLRPTTPDLDQPFYMIGQTQIYAPGVEFDIPVGRWMGIRRIDDITSGTVVNGGTTPAACYHVSLLS